MTLYRETPCEHGNIDCRMARNADRIRDCPGGSREEVTIDYDLAYNTAISKGIDIRPSQFDELKIVINVALGVTEEK